MTIPSLRDLEQQFRDEAEELRVMLRDLYASGRHLDAQTVKPVRDRCLDHAQELAAVREALEQKLESESGIAEFVARQVHRDQREESTGDPYILHVERVVNLVEGEQAKAVAWLHDVLEDSAMTVGGLMAFKLSNAVLWAVELLTRVAPYDYAGYIDKIRDAKGIQGDLARAVKVADLKDHLRPNCPTSLVSRYERALADLAACLVGAKEPR